MTNKNLDNSLTVKQSVVKLAILLKTHDHRPNTVCAHHDAPLSNYSLTGWRHVTPSHHADASVPETAGSNEEDL